MRLNKLNGLNELNEFGERRPRFQKLLSHKYFYYPFGYLPLDATIISMVHKNQPQLAVGICVAPNAVVRMIK